MFNIHSTYIWCTLYDVVLDVSLSTNSDTMMVSDLKRGSLGVDKQVLDKECANINQSLKRKISNACSSPVKKPNTFADFHLLGKQPLVKDLLIKFVSRSNHTSCIFQQSSTDFIQPSGFISFKLV